MFHATRIALAALALLCAAAHAETPWVWWEGEQPAETNFPETSSFGEATFREKADEVLSGAKWLTNDGKRAAGEAEAFAKYKVNVPAEASYQLWTRKFWKHGPFRWRFGEAEWRECGRDCALADSSYIRLHLGANWVYLGEVKLPKGEQTFELRLLAKEGENKTACFDCFVLIDGVFTPRGKLKPGETSGLAMPGHFAFEPANDAFDSSALFDLRELNEKESGVNGPLKIDGLDFKLGNGKRERMWSVQASVDMDDASLEYMARRFAKNGVNHVRIEAKIAELGNADPAVYDAKHLDRIHRAAAAFKKAGIYLYLGHVWWGTWSPNGAWGLPDGYDGKKSGHALLHFNSKMEAVYRGWVRTMLATKNPYTGVALKDDPTLATFEIQNEDSYLFWTFPKLLTPASRRELGKHFGDWLAKKHGSLDKALEAWGGQKAKGDDFAAGVADFLEQWNLTTDGLSKQPQWKARAGDQLQFLVESQRAFYDRTVKFIKEELGAKCLVSCSNWKTADARLMDALERYTYLAGDVVCRNNYFGPKYLSKRKRFYAVDTEEVFVSRCGMLMPEALPIQLNQIDGRPTMVTEINWERPNRYRCEFPFLAATYGNLQGMDGWNFFATGNAQWESSPAVWSIMNPSLFGMFPACALMCRRGDIKEAETVVHQSLDLKEQYAFKGSAVREEQGFDELRKKDIPAGGMLQGKDFDVIDPLAFYVGRVVYDCDGDKSRNKLIDLSKYIDHEKKLIKSVTGELEWDYGAGVAIVNTPKSQGACGMLVKKGKLDLGDVIVESQNEYGSVLVVALDDKPLAQSQKILIQAVTEDAHYGWKTEPSGEGEKILALGTYPLNVKKIQAKVTFKKPGALKEALILDGNAYDTGKRATVSTAGGALTVTLPEDALYTVVR
ncbi:MAG: hypothetical protein M5U26_09555 [Planctomycetota bacterium]|nr:hypothetical protein [Planctomycetota bacterium]